MRVCVCVCVCVMCVCVCCVYMHILYPIPQFRQTYTKVHCLQVDNGALMDVYCFLNFFFVVPLDPKQHI